jgi:integrase
MAKTLTAAAVEKLKPDPTKRREVPDGGQTNLYFVIQPSGARSWAVRYRLHGKPQKFTVGDYPTFSLADARTEARKALQAVTDGRNPTIERKARRQADEAAADTFERAARQWLERYVRKELRLNSQMAAERALEKAIARWRDRPLASIARRDVRELFEDMAETPVAANRTLAALSSMCAWHLERERIPANPCAGIKRLKETSRERTLTDDELKAVWLAAGELGWPFQQITRLMILTGMRREELGGLLWCEVHEDRIELPRERTKNGQPHTIPLSAPAREIVAGLHRIHSHAFVFNRTGAARMAGFTEAKRRLDKLSGVTDWVWHDTRRTLATGLQRLGVRFEVTEACINHRTGSRSGVAGIYQRHDWADEKRAALEAWARHVIELVEGRPAAKVVELNARR